MTYAFAPKLLNRQQACWYLGDISPRKLDQLQAEGHISPKALGGVRGYLRDDLDRLAESLKDWADRTSA